VHNETGLPSVRRHSIGAVNVLRTSLGFAGPGGAANTSDDYLHEVPPCSRSGGQGVRRVVRCLIRIEHEREAEGQEQAALLLVLSADVRVSPAHLAG
jgi:hypothetical protein